MERFFLATDYFVSQQRHFMASSLASHSCTVSFHGICRYAAANTRVTAEVGRRGDELRCYKKLRLCVSAVKFSPNCILNNISFHHPVSAIKLSYLKFFMDNLKAKSPAPAWKGRIIKFLMYLVIGFLCAFIYRQIKE